MAAIIPTSPTESDLSSGIIRENLTAAVTAWLTAARSSCFLVNLIVAPPLPQCLVSIIPPLLAAMG
jgi:hypothetical protein